MNWINDVSALSDPHMLEVVVEFGCPICIMHMQGSPERMQIEPIYGDVVDEVRTSLTTVAKKLSDEGISPNLIIIDPGIGFGKLLEHNLSLLTAGRQIVPNQEMSLLWGVSRKRMFEDLLGRSESENRLAGTLGHIGVFSFENKKHMTCGSEGGMIVTDDENLATRARKFSGLGYKHMTGNAGRTSLALSEVQDPHYERFDTVGLNYRMNEISAAVGLGQLERLEEIVDKRKKSANFFKEAVEGCNFLEMQRIPNCCEHSHYTFTVKYTGEELTGLTWKDFYNCYVEMGGDGFYGACKVPYLEPAFKGLSVNGITYSKGICPVAEEIQPQIMQFKTNYRDPKLAEYKADILHQTIKKVSGK